jgi:hypothetical protein
VAGRTTGGATGTDGADGAGVGVSVGAGVGVDVTTGAGGAAAQPATSKTPQ